MAQEYLPAPSNVRLADLMKEHNISQPELAKEIAAPRVRRTESHEQESAEKMFTELTKGQDVQHPTITAEQLADAMLDSVSGMEGATPEALEQLRSGLLGILQSAAEQENAHEADE
mgnify:CR=1 FL=1